MKKDCCCPCTKLLLPLRTANCMPRNISRITSSGKSQLYGVVQPLSKVCMHSQSKSSGTLAPNFAPASSTCQVGDIGSQPQNTRRQWMRRLHIQRQCIPLLSSPPPQIHLPPRCYYSGCITAGTYNQYDIVSHDFAVEALGISSIDEI